MMKYLLILSFLISSQAFSFSKKMLHYKVSFNQKRKVSDLKDMIEQMSLTNENKVFFQSIVSKYSNNELPLLEFNGSNLVFKYQNQKSIGEINLDREVLLIENHKISLDVNNTPKEIFTKIDTLISEKEGDAFLMFLTSETREQTSLLNSKLQALFWSLSIEYSKNLNSQNFVRRNIASDKK